MACNENQLPEIQNLGHPPVMVADQEISVEVPPDLSGNVGTNAH